jgi:hypothetical protein
MIAAMGRAEAFAIDPSHRMVKCMANASAIQRRGRRGQRNADGDADGAPTGATGHRSGMDDDHSAD